MTNDTTSTTPSTPEIPKADWEHLLDMCIYTCLIGYNDSNGHSIPCKEREGMKERIVARFKKELASQNVPFVSAQPAKGLRWVRSSERMPEVDKTQRVWKDKYGNLYVKQFLSPVEPAASGFFIEWLEEIPAPSPLEVKTI
jgi:hypothetical protein